MSHRQYFITAEAIAKEKERAGTAFDVSRILQLDPEFRLREMGPKDVELKIRYFSLEHNVDHALSADTINIAETRGGRIYPGNSAVGEVVAVGAQVTRFKPGDIVITHCNGEPDANGYPLRIWAYDQPESIGWYGERAMVGEWQLIKAPTDCGLGLERIAALPLRAPTAYHNWRRAIGIYNLKVTPTENRKPLNVLSFGGGVGELFLMLAKSQGHNAFYCSGTLERLAAMEAMGIHGINQKLFNRFATAEDIKAFNKVCKKLTGDVGMHIVNDMLRGPCFDAGLAVAARCGVNVSSGWQLSQIVKYNTTIASVKQVTIDHTHYETPEGCEEATGLYGSVFRPTIHSEVYSFDDVPRAMREMHDNKQTGIPIVRVN